MNMQRQTKYRDFSALKVGDQVNKIVYGSNYYTGVITWIGRCIHTDAIVLHIKADSYTDVYKNKTTPIEAELQVNEFYERPVELVAA